MNTIRIDNSRNKKEISILAAIFSFCGVTAFTLIAIRSPLPVLLKVIILVILLTGWFFILYKSLKKTNRDKGTLIIDKIGKQFSLNNEPFQPYNKLDFYDFSLVGGGKYIRTGPYSSMYITLGTNGKIFKMNDDDASKRLDDIQKETLAELVAGSSLSEEQKKTFEGWLIRLNIKSKP
jgi:hypothetical protein